MWKLQLPSKHISGGMFFCGLLTGALFCFAQGPTASVLAQVAERTSAATPLPSKQAANPNGECTPMWQRVPSPSLAADQTWFTDISASSPDNAWAVGIFNRGTWSDSVMARWDGKEWRHVVSPQGNNIPTAVEAISADDVWVVGTHGSAVWPLLEHWDGARWNLVTTGKGQDRNDLFDISAASSNDVWAVGEYTDSYLESVQMLIQHWDGSSWTVVPAPQTGDSSSLQGVHALAPDDVWAVGYYVDNEGRHPLTVHWDGDQWTVIPAPDLGSGGELTAIKARSASDAWAVGWRYPDIDDTNRNTRLLVMQWDGAVWSVIPGPDVNDLTGQLKDVTITESGEVWIAGSSFIARRDGANWVVTQSRDPEAAAYNSISAIANDRAGGLWAAGAVHRPNIPAMETLTLRYDTHCTTPTPTATVCPMEFSDVPADSPFYGYTKCLACRGVIGGYGDGSFRPGDKVTRGQLAKIVATAASVGGDTGGQTFQDVPPSSTYYQWIDRLSSIGVVGGYPCGESPDEPCVGPRNLPYYRPNANATRAQIAKIVSETAGFNELLAGGRIFWDLDGSGLFDVWIERLRLHHGVTGYPCGTRPDEPCGNYSLTRYFRPAEPATRGQVARIIAAVFYPNCAISPP